MHSSKCLFISDVILIEQSFMRSLIFLVNKTYLVHFGRIILLCFLQYEMESLITRRNELVGTVGRSCVRNALGDIRMHNQLNPRNIISNEVEAMFLDTKGGEKGALPSGQDKYLK